MLRPPCYIFSDVHLGVATADTERLLRDFLRSLRGRAASLVINGDLFDFWFEWRAVVPRVGYRTVAALADLSESGTEILMLAGNHDCWGGEILRADAGVAYRLEPWEGELAGWRTRLDHGDGLRPRADRGYRALRRVIRHPLAVRAFRLIHPDLATRLARGSSATSRRYHPADEGVELREIALRTLDARPELELLVLAHSHVAALERAPRGGVYANAGSWLDAPTFLVVTPERIEMRQWRGGSAESERLDAIDRRPEKAPA